MAPEGLEPAIDRARTRVGTRTQRRSLLWAADPDGFFIAEFPGEPVGSVAAVAYGPSFGFGGLYVARPELGVVGSATTCGRRQPLVSARTLGPRWRSGAGPKLRRGGFAAHERPLSREHLSARSRAETGSHDPRPLRRGGLVRPCGLRSFPGERDRRLHGEITHPLGELRGRRPLPCGPIHSDLSSRAWGSPSDFWDDSPKR